MRLIWVLLGLGGLYYYRKNKAADLLQYYPQGVEISKGVLYFALEVVNPSREELYFDNLFATIGAQDLRIGRIQYVGRTYIRPQSTTILKFPIKALYLDLGTFLARVYKKEINQVTIQGTINSMGLNIPFENQIPLTF